MNTWQNRLWALAMFVSAVHIHAYCLEDIENTPMGMLIFHGSAGLVDLLLLYCVPVFLSGKLCSDVEMLCMTSIAVNFAGWLLYLAYAPPVIYNTLEIGLTYIQWGRLLVTDENNANYMGRNLVRRSINGRT